MISARDREPLVLDRFVSEDMFKSICNHVQQMPFTPVSEESSFNIWRRNAPGNPETGATLIWSFGGMYPAEIVGRDAVLIFPSATPLDDLCKKIRTALGELQELNDEECVGLILTAYRYNPGDRLVWHEDKAYLAAFSFYVSASVSENGGGQFAYRITDSDSRGTFVEPVPNRLVLFSSGLQHSVFPVALDSPARLSLSGFFVSRNNVESLLARFEP